MNSGGDFDEPEYPNWLYRELIEGLLPWQHGKKIDFKRFTEKYTLHDSYWIGIFSNVGCENTATLAIQWDPVWLPDEIQQSTSNVGDSLYLFILLTKIEQISINNYVDIKGHCRSIGTSAVEEIDGKKFLAIDDIYGGQISIIYQGEETFLAMDKHKCLLSI